MLASSLRKRNGRRRKDRGHRPRLLSAQARAVVPPTKQCHQRPSVPARRFRIRSGCEPEISPAPRASPAPSTTPGPIRRPARSPPWRRRPLPAEQRHRHPCHFHRRQPAKSRLVTSSRRQTRRPGRVPRPRTKLMTIAPIGRGQHPRHFHPPRGRRVPARRFLRHPGCNIAGARGQFPRRPDQPRPAAAFRRSPLQLREKPHDEIMRIDDLFRRDRQPHPQIARPKIPPPQRRASGCAGRCGPSRPSTTSEMSGSSE